AQIAVLAHLRIRVFVIGHVAVASCHGVRRTDAEGAGAVGAVPIPGAAPPAVLVDGIQRANRAPRIESASRFRLESSSTTKRTATPPIPFLPPLKRFGAQHGEVLPVRRRHRPWTAGKRTEAEVQRRPSAVRGPRDAATAAPDRDRIAVGCTDALHLHGRASRLL